VKHIEQLVGTSTFVGIKPSLLLEIVSDDHLLFTEDGFYVGSARQEQRVLESVLQYIASDAPNRVGLLAEFLSKGVRLALIPPEMLHSTRKSFVKNRQVATVLEAVLRALSMNAIGVTHRMTGTVSCDCSLLDLLFLGLNG
jgi:BTB And C-terminal Kelch